LPFASARERDAGTCHNAPGKGASWPIREALREHHRFRAAVAARGEQLERAAAVGLRAAPAA
jgi:hypothetical protein